MPVYQWRNTIHLIGEINEENTQHFLTAYNIAFSDNSKKIELHISSNGGDIVCATQIGDSIQTS